MDWNQSLYDNKFHDPQRIINAIKQSGIPYEWIEWSDYIVPDGRTHGLVVTLPNGYELSIQYGFAHHADENSVETAILRPNRGGFEPYPPTDEGHLNDINGKWYSPNDVQDYQTIDEVIETLRYAASLKGEEDEGESGSMVD